MDNQSQRYEAPRAPVHPSRFDAADSGDQRRGNGSTSGRAVPRSESGGSAASSPNAGSAKSGSDGSRSGDRSSGAVPAYSRPRDDRNVTGKAVPRTGPVPDDDHHHGSGYYPGYYPGYIYDPYYSFYYDPFYSTRYGYWSPYGYGYGLGYFSYDPFLFGAMSYYGGYDPSFNGYGGGGAGGGSSTSSSQVYPGAGSLRLKVKPRNAEVFIDGFSVGTIDGFDGVFQRLDVQAGPHKVELKADGYQTEQFDVIVKDGETITYKGDMKRR